MAISHETLEATLKDLGLKAQREGEQYLILTKGQSAPLLRSVLTRDEDGSGITILTGLPLSAPLEKRAAIYELLNLVHGQSLWNVRFHLDEGGRLFSIGKCLLWGKPFNAVQFGDIFFSLVVTTDRLYPSLAALIEGSQTPSHAFERFFKTS